MTITVIIVTLDRPDYVRRCLACLKDQAPRQPDQVIVVDASADDRTRRVVSEFAAVVYLQNPNGFGRMTASRNIGLKSASGEVIAFLDDDAFAQPQWMEELLKSFDDPSIGAAGGRALNNQPDEANQGLNEIGKLKANGQLTGNFGARPHAIIEVDHIIGCNMSFRRAVLARLGGFRTDYPGISGVREDSDMCVRVKALGYRIVFNPLAAVDHIGAPQSAGRRFDLRYQFYAHRNHTVLLLRNFGMFSGLLWQSLIGGAATTAWAAVRKIVGAFASLAVFFAGVVVGVSSGLLLILKNGRDPVRRDAEAREITQHLSGHKQDVNLSQSPAATFRAAITTSC